MSDSNDNIAMSTAMSKAQADKKNRPAKAKAAPQAPVRQFPQATARQIVTFATAARICPNEGVATKIVSRYGLEAVDYDAIRQATRDQMTAGGNVLVANLNEKALEMHMQRIVDSYVRSAHGAGGFYDGKAKLARDLASSIGNEDRDEDRPGIDGTENKAQRAGEFAAQVGLQAYALLAAAHGALDAYEHHAGKEWKPYEGTATPMQQVARQAIALRAGAFDRD